MTDIPKSPNGICQPFSLETTMQRKLLDKITIFYKSASVSDHISEVRRELNQYIYRSKNQDFDGSIYV